MPNKFAPLNPTVTLAHEFYARAEAERAKVTALEFWSRDSLGRETLCFPTAAIKFFNLSEAFRAEAFKLEMSAAVKSLLTLGKGI